MAESTLNAEMIQGAAAFDRLSAEWDDLAGRAMTDTPFQSLAYQKAWWTHLGPGTLSTIVARDEADGALRGLLCVYAHKGLIHFNGCVEETDYLDLLAAEADARAVWDIALDCLLGPEAPAWHTLEFCNVPAWSPTLRILPELTAARGLSCAVQAHEVCPVIALPDRFETYLDGLDRKQRHEVRRKLRRAVGADARIEVVHPGDDIRAEVESFLSLLERSTPEKGVWLNPARRAVFHEVAAAALDAGTLQLMFISTEGQRAAALFNFVYRDRVWVYNSGLDPDNFGWLSAGVVLTARAIELAIEAGLKTFDFLRGDEEYKYRFGAVDTQIFRLTLKRASP